MTTPLAHDDDHERQHGHPLDEFVVDPSDMPPLCDEQEFADLLEGMVADEAPRLFAIAQEYGERVDAEIAAWGLAFSDRVEVVSAMGTMRVSARDPETAVPLFDVGGHIRARLVWFNPDAATPAEDAGEAD